MNRRPLDTSRKGLPGRGGGARASRIVGTLFSSSTACYALLAETMSPEQIVFSASLSNLWLEPFSRDRIYNIIACYAYLNLGLYFSDI